MIKLVCRKNKDLLIKFYNIEDYPGDVPHKDISGIVGVKEATNRTLLFDFRNGNINFDIFDEEKEHSS